jgi:hypothetical protein
MDRQYMFNINQLTLRPDRLFFQGGLDPKNSFLHWQFKIMHRSNEDPEQPPHKEPGDSFIIFGALAGIIIGSTSGVIISRITDLNILCIFVGAIIGGIAGTLVGSSIKKHVQNRDSKPKQP